MHPGINVILIPHRSVYARPVYNSTFPFQIVFAALLAVAVAAPQKEVRTLSQKFETDPQGNYEYQYALDNGQAVEEVGRVQAGPEPETGTISQQGSFTFVGDDGITYTVSYLADEGGFQPQAAHLPVAPPQIKEYAELRSKHPELF